MSLSSGTDSKTAANRTTPTALIEPEGSERWNYIDVMRDANDVDAEISFDSGGSWLPLPGKRSGWSGPFARSAHRVLVRPKVDGQSVTGLAALARLVLYPGL